ncbi:MAG TPA: family 20 glycosylhydrolase [Flavisolibacter sp.]|nr:family 20 glycosylhydrolase [Flavisolibacter sp.]
MRLALTVFICAAFLFGVSINAQQSKNKQPYIAIIPRPLSLVPGQGAFLLSSNTRIVVEPGKPSTKKIAEMLAAQIQSQTGIKLLVTEHQKNSKSNAIVFSAKNAPDSLQNEGYQLTVNHTSIVINAKTPNGQFYGMQTLLQLLPVGETTTGKKSIPLPAVAIYDKPRFSWRGVMLDVGRYYYSIDFLKKFLDYMSIHKLNTFHWHLTEDHGWRIEIKKYPKLTQVGAWRSGTQFDRTQVNNIPHGGYYTQEQVKELVAYAADRYITIVPEIEMPGHSLAALVAYPELSCTGGPFQMPVKWNIQKDVYCAGNEKTFEFLENVLTEITALFPGPIIHIGGDECPKDRWKNCPKCQARIKALGLKDEYQLQSYFIHRIEKFLLTKNRNIIGWDEILEGGLAPNASVMSWRGIKGGIEAAKQKHNVVMTPSDYYYLDYYQGEPYLEPIAIGNGGMISLKKVYDYEPVSEELTPEEAKYITGVQGNVWSEFIHSPDKVEYMLYPRAAALAETGWSAPSSKDWKDFSKRMEIQYQRYEKAGINYSKSAYNVTFNLTYDSLNKYTLVNLNTLSYDPVIRYTTNGNEPTATSPVYSKAIIIDKPTLLKAASFKKGKRFGKISEMAVMADTTDKRN